MRSLNIFQKKKAESIENKHGVLLESLPTELFPSGKKRVDLECYFDKSIIDTAIDDIAIDTIKEVGPDGHFFGCQHTQDRYETAFYQPMISDWSNFEAWDINGGVWTAERAHKVYKEIINEFQAPEIDISIKDELAEFVTKRKSEGGAPTDF